MCASGRAACGVGVGDAFRCEQGVAQRVGRADVRPAGVCICARGEAHLHIANVRDARGINQPKFSQLPDRRTAEDHCVGAFAFFHPLTLRADGVECSLDAMSRRFGE